MVYIAQIVVLLLYVLFIYSFKVKKLQNTKFIQFFLKDDRKYVAIPFFYSVSAFIFLCMCIYGFDWLITGRYVGDKRDDVAYTIPYFSFYEIETRRSPRTGTPYDVTIGYFRYVVNGEEYSTNFQLNGVYNNLFALKVNTKKPKKAELFPIPKTKIIENTAIILLRDVDTHIVHYVPSINDAEAEFMTMYNYNENGNAMSVTNNLEELTRGIDNLIEVPIEGWKESPYTLITGKEQTEEIIYQKHMIAYIDIILHDKVDVEYRKRVIESQKELLSTPSEKVLYTIPTALWYYAEEKEDPLFEKPSSMVDMIKFSYVVHDEVYVEYFDVPENYWEYMYALKVHSDFPELAGVIPIPYSELKENTAFLMADSRDYTEQMVYYPKSDTFPRRLDIHEYYTNGNYIEINEDYSMLSKEELIKDVSNLIEVPENGWSENPYKLFTGEEYIDETENIFYIMIVILSWLGAVYFLTGGVIKLVKMLR